MGRSSLGDAVEEVLIATPLLLQFVDAGRQLKIATTLLSLLTA
jgi:hypothetical protein